ncbi:MAG: glycosyltransferase family 4 protein [Actinobacteria bacterium]|nr:glycosyltransferase family 4 protein [Actinomycetota bacterium]
MAASTKSLARSAYRRYRRHEALRQPRLGYFSPLPPAPTGVATYSAAVLEGLRRIGFFEARRMDAVWPIEPRHEGLAPGYRLGIYHLGNNVEFHADIYRFACLAPGLIVLHDLALDDFVLGMKAAGDPLGFAADREARRLRSRLASADVHGDGPLREPWCGHVLRRSRGVIVHSEFCRRYLEELGSRTPVFVVPHPVVESVEAMRAAEARRGELRARAGAREEDVLVVAPGDLNAAKQLEALLSAAGTLDPTVRLALVGRRIEGYDVYGAVKAAGLGNRVTLAPDVSDDEFRGWLFAADVIVDLRHPHRGEVSGSLARALQAGRPAIVSATGTYLDVPEEIVLRVTAGPADPQELAARIRALAEDPDLRARMGAAAASLARHLRETEATAHGYAGAIESTLGLVRDPARKAYARWAGALADLGVDEEMLSRGYGLSYAKAMESFVPRRVSSTRPGEPGA